MRGVSQGDPGGHRCSGSSWRSPSVGRSSSRRVAGTTTTARPTARRPSTRRRVNRHGGACPVHRRVGRTRGDRVRFLAGDRRRAAPGRPLRYAHANTPSRFDPHRSTIGQDIRFFAPVYDRLVHFDANGDLVPGLATEWEFSEDGLQFTMTLREGVVFHDGAPFDAERGEGQYRARPDAGRLVGQFGPRRDHDDRDPDPTTVVFTLSAPNSMLPGMLSHRAGAMVSPTAFENPDLDRAPVGAGPYRVTEYAEGSRIVYERFEDYWDPSVGGPDRIEVAVMPDSRTRLNALTSGEVDLAQIGASALRRRGQRPADRQRSRADLPRAAAQPVTGGARRPVGAPGHEPRHRPRGDRRGCVLRRRRSGRAAVPEGYFAYNPDFPGDHYAYDPSSPASCSPRRATPTASSSTCSSPPLTCTPGPARPCRRCSPTSGSPRPSSRSTRPRAPTSSTPNSRATACSRSGAAGRTRRSRWSCSSRRPDSPTRGATRHPRWRRPTW